MRETKDSEERKEEFVEAAERLFKENGIVDTTVSSIVKEMNVAKGLFYYYFKSKDDVIDAISKKYNETFSESMKRNMETTDYFEKLDRFIVNCVESFAELGEMLQGNSKDVDLAKLTERSIDQAKRISSASLKKLLDLGNKIEKIQIDNTEYYADMIIGGIAYLTAKGKTDSAEIGKIVRSLIEQAGKEN